MENHESTRAVPIQHTVMMSTWSPHRHPGMVDNGHTDAMAVLGEVVGTDASAGVGRANANLLGVEDSGVEGGHHSIRATKQVVEKNLVVVVVEGGSRRVGGSIVVEDCYGGGVQSSRTLSERKYLAR
jgi:hypothetical protein